LPRHNELIGGTEIAMTLIMADASPQVKTPVGILVGGGPAPRINVASSAQKICPAEQFRDRYQYLTTDLRGVI